MLEIVTECPMCSYPMRLFQEQKLSNLQASLDGMNDSITKLENEIQASRLENENLQETLKNLQEQVTTQQERLQEVSADNMEKTKW